MSELQDFGELSRAVLIRQQAYRYQIRHARVNAPYGEQVPTFGYSAGEHTSRELAPLSPRAAHLIDQLLLAAPEVRWGIVRHVVTGQPVPAGDLAAQLDQADEGTRQQVVAYLRAAYPRTSARWL